MYISLMYIAMALLKCGMLSVGSQQTTCHIYIYVCIYPLCIWPLLCSSLACCLLASHRKHACMHAAKRKHNVLPGLDAPKLSLKKVKRVLELSADPDQVDLYKELRESLDIHTPCGPLLDDIPVPCEDGTNYIWTICNPFALLFIMASHFIKFAGFLRQSLRAMGDHLLGSIVLYSDETTHGNVLRHDSANELQCDN